MVQTKFKKKRKKTLDAAFIFNLLISSSVDVSTLHKSHRTTNLHPEYHKMILSVLLTKTGTMTFICSIGVPLKRSTQCCNSECLSKSIIAWNMPYWLVLNIINIWNTDHLPSVDAAVTWQISSAIQNIIWLLVAMLQETANSFHVNSWSLFKALRFPCSAKQDLFIKSHSVDIFPFQLFSLPNVLTTYKTNEYF